MKNADFIDYVKLNELGVVCISSQRRIVPLAFLGVYCVVGLLGFFCLRDLNVWLAIISSGLVVVIGFLEFTSLRFRCFVSEMLSRNYGAESISEVDSFQRDMPKLVDGCLSLLRRDNELPPLRDHAKAGRWDVMRDQGITLGFVMVSNAVNVDDDTPLGWIVSVFRAGEWEPTSIITTNIPEFFEGLQQNGFGK